MSALIDFGCPTCGVSTACVRVKYRNVDGLLQDYCINDSFGDVVKMLDYFWE